MKYKKIYILLLIIVGAFLFYWFQWRPSEIRKMCENEALHIEQSSSLLKAMKIPVSKSSQNNKYRDCLVKNGLKPESLFVNLR